MEIGSLRDVLNMRKKKGKFNDVENQLLKLKVCKYTFKSEPNLSKSYLGRKSAS